MLWQGKIDFAKPITINGKPHGIEHEASLPIWNASYIGKIVHDEGTDKLWLATSTGWVELTPGGIATHNHDERYFTEVEVDSMFDGKNGTKQQINWTNVINRPTTVAPDVHNNNAHSEVYLTAADVDFTFLQDKSLIGTGANQAAVGNHTHLEIGVCPPTNGLPTDTPIMGTMRFDSATNTLYIFNGTAWVSTVLS